MKEFLLKIFNSEIMHYVVVPIVVPIVVALLGWMKNKHDLKEKNKELGYWMMKWRKLPTFQELALKNYKIFAMNLVIMSIVRLVFVFWKGRIFSYIVSGILYFGLNGIVVFLNCRSANSKMELWKAGRKKELLIFILYMIYGIPFFLDLYGKYVWIAEIIFCTLLLVWAICLLNYFEVAFVLDNRYADIYVKGSEKAQFAAAGSIKKQGEWIIVNRYVNEYDEEIRIKESDIVRIDYYGGPIIIVEKRKWLKRYKY